MTRHLLALLASSLIAAIALPAERVPIDSFDTGKGWSAVGRAQVEREAKGFRRGCLKMTFGTKGSRNFAIVQGLSPAAAKAWERGQTGGLNAFVFHARATAPISLHVVLRVRARKVQGVKGVQGHFRGTVALQGSQWREYAICFTDFRGPSKLGKVGDAVFRQWWPQVQFHAAVASLPGGKPVTVWVDELAFGQSDRSSAGDLPMVYPGLDQLSKLGPATSKSAVVSVAPPSRGRQRQAVNTDWTFVPFDNEKAALAAAKVIKIPSGWPGKRAYSAGWYLRRLEVPAGGRGRVFLQFERVAFYCAAFVNGRKVGEHAGGFTPFEFDLTPALKAGLNHLAVYVMDATVALRGDRSTHQLGVMRPTRIRYQGGVFGRAWIETRPAAYVSDVFVTTSTRSKRIEVHCELVNPTNRAVTGELRLSVHEWRSHDAADVALPPTRVSLGPGEATTVSVSAAWATAKLWSPEQPQLYVLRAELATDAGRDQFDQRFGFREFWIDRGQFVLNGVPTRLRGQSSFRGHSMVPLSLNRGYLRTAFRAWKREFGVNAFRLHASIVSEPVLEVGDEEGLLFIDQSSIWSAMGGHYRRGGKRFLANTRREFGEWVRRDRNHPSVVIWDVENEQIRGRGRDGNMEWVMPLDGFVRRFDTTRPVEHSGAGHHGPDHAIYHVHMEEHYTKLFELWSKRPDRPLINGEYWIGGRGEARLPSSKETGALAEFFEEELRLYHESIVEQRAYGVSGVMPFTVWRTAFEPLAPGRRAKVPADPNDPDPRPWAADSRFNPGWIPNAPAYRLRPNAGRYLRNALGPVTAFFWPRSESAIAGEPVERTIVVCNDSETRQTIAVAWGLGRGSVGRREVALGPAEQARIPCTIDVPAAVPACTMFVEATGSDGQPTRDELSLRGIAASKLKPPTVGKRIWCTDPSGVVAGVLRHHGIASQATDRVPDAGGIWIVAPDALAWRMDGMAAGIRTFMERGGCILCLSQERLPAWCPVRLNSWSAVRQTPVAFAGFGWQDGWKDIYYSRHAPIYAPGHPVFDGLPFDDLRWWDAIDGRVSDDALARPAATGAVARGNWRPLLGACRRENMSLVEMSVGKGMLMLCSAHVVRQIGHPEARLLLWNILRYLDQPLDALPHQSVRVAGADTASRVRLLTGAEATPFRADAAGGVVVAGPGANGAQLAAWARRTGGTVVLLSAAATAALPGFEVKANASHAYMACRGEPHPLLWGLATCSFEDVEHPAVKGEIAKHPEGCRVLLRGLSGPKRRAVLQTGTIAHTGVIALDRCGPAAVEWRVGRGTVIATTLEPFDAASPRAAEILSIVLTNAGVRIDPPLKTKPRVRALRTVPLKLDGRLDDWTNDVEDRNVSPFRHGEPIVLGADTLVAGQTEGDHKLSGIAYFLWDDAALYVAGLAIGADRVLVRVGDQRVEMRMVGEGLEATLAGKPVKCSTSRLDARRFIDARLLTFAEIDSRIGNVRPVRGPVRARTFELRLLWRSLGLAPREATTFSVEVRRGTDAALRVPTAGRGETGTLVFAE